MLELYHYNNSICSERSRMVLHEKGITDWVSHEVDLFRGEQFEPEYIRLNPKAQTPTLVHDGHIVRESSIVSEYIDDVFPEPPLKPASAAGVADMREWVKVSDDRLYECVAALSFMSVFRKVMTDKGQDGMAEHFRKGTDLSRIMRQKSCIEEGIDSEYVIRGSWNMQHIVDDLEARLADGRDWVMGDQYTLVEIAYSPFLARVEALEMLDLFTGGRPLTEEWWRRCTERDSFTSAEVGPAMGEEAGRYAKYGRASRTEVAELVDRIRSTEPWEMAG